MSLFDAILLDPATYHEWLAIHADVPGEAALTQSGPSRKEHPLLSLKDSQNLLRIFMKRLLRALLIGFGLAIQASYAQTFAVFTPPGSRDHDGNSFIPIDRARPQQQLFPAEWFSQLPKGGAILTTVSFRSDAGLTGQFEWGEDVTGVEIGVSTTQKTSQSLSPIFADNVGPDRTLITDAGYTTALTNVRGGLGNVSSFSLRFGSNPDGFLYDPAKGNLLLEVRGLRFPFGLDAFTSDQDIAVNYSAADPSGLNGRLSNQGYVVLFVFYPVPEPATAGILAVGILEFLALRHLHNRNPAQFHLSGSRRKETDF